MADALNIRCMVVDDEPLSQEILLKYISDVGFLTLVAVSSDAIEAGEKLRDELVDLLFLDINMPRVSGIQLLKSLVKPPLVIFTTAYPEFAVEGFELAAVDYLLKPFSFERFLKAVNKAIEVMKARNFPQAADRVMWFKSDKKLIRTDIDDIDYIEAIGDYVKVVLATGSFIVHDTMQGMEEKMRNKDFIRIHRSYIVSALKIEYIEGNQVIIKDKVLPIGMSYRENFFKNLKQ